MKKLTIAAVALLALAGCSPSAGAPETATDPRDGRVTILYENCLNGGCVWDWKVCIGPDLLMSIAHKEHTVKDSPECLPREAQR